MIKKHKKNKKTDNNETDGVSDMSELVFGGGGGGGGGVHTRADWRRCRRLRAATVTTSRRRGAERDGERLWEREADNLGRRRRLIMKKYIYYIIIILNEPRTRGDAQTTATGQRFSRQ